MLRLCAYGKPFAREADTDFLIQTNGAKLAGRYADRRTDFAGALYRTLSRRGNPSFKTLVALLEAMGMRLAVEPVGRQRWPAGDPPL